MPPSSTFLNEFTRLLEILATFQLPVKLTGDLNIHLQKRDDVESVRLVDVLSSFNLLQHVSSPTHGRSGLLDVFIASGDLRVCLFMKLDYLIICFCRGLQTCCRPLQSTLRQPEGDGGTLTLTHLFLSWRI